MPVQFDPEDPVAVYTAEEIDAKLAKMGAGAGATDAQVAAAVANWFTANPITPDRVSGLQAALDSMNAAMTGYGTRLGVLEKAPPGTAAAATWAALSGKPAVIAAGGTQAEARLAVGVGTSATVPAGSMSGWANVVTDHGANNGGGADCGPAFRAAAATGRPVFIPPGSYNFATGPGMYINPTNYGQQTPKVLGSGRDQCSINLAPGLTFIESGANWPSFHLSSIRFNGGYGYVKNTSTAGNVSDEKIIEDCWFNGFTGCAIQDNHPDGPYFKIRNNHFMGANCTSSMCIALKGFTDSCTIENNAFLLYRVGVKLDRGCTAHLLNNDFLQFVGGQGQPRPAIWVVPDFSDLRPPPAANIGHGLTITACKFGNENLGSGDYRILYADEINSGVLWGDRWPDLVNVSSKRLAGHRINDCCTLGGGGGTIPLVYSMTAQLFAMCIGPNHHWGSDFTPQLTFKNATGFNPNNSIVGPLLANGVNQASPPALVTTESGTLTGQPRSL